MLGLTLAAGSATLAVDRLQSNVTTIDISDQIGHREVDWGDLQSGPVTILVMGSDERTGRGNKGYGYFEGARSDTTLLVHLYPDRGSAVVVSIPRDTVVELPACRGPDGTLLGPVRDRFNQAFDRGGPGCTLKATEALSGLEVDHFVVVDFNGFKRTVDALGGVQVCLTHPLQDAKSGVDLPAGYTRVTGEDALAFVRVRHNIGDGSDIGRINRQQLFLSSLIQEVSDSNLLTSPVRLWRVLDESTKSLTTDPAMADPKGILALARSLSGIRPDDITFVTLPWLPSGDGATIVPDERRAARIWRAIAAEQPWPPSTRGADGRKLTEKPSGIVVDIRDATGTADQGTRAGDELSAERFRIGALTSASARPRTVIRHSPGQLEAARTLQAAVPGAVLREDDGRGDRLLLVLGESYAGIRAVRVTTKGPRSADEGASAAQDICTG